MPAAWAGRASRGRREGGSLLFQAASAREAEAHPQRVPRAGASAWERCELPQAPVSRHQQRSTTGQRSSFLWKEGQEPGWRGSGSGTSSRGGRESCRQLSLQTPNPPGYTQTFHGEQPTLTHAEPRCREERSGPTTCRPRACFARQHPC